MGLLRHRYTILAAVGVVALAIVLLPVGVARFLGLDDQLGWVFLIGTFALLVSGVRLVFAMLRRQRAMNVHLRQCPSDPVEDMKTIAAMDLDLRQGEH